MAMVKCNGNGQPTTGAKQVCPGILKEMIEEEKNRNMKLAALRQKITSEGI